jgi:hypothetical protein
MADVIHWDQRGCAWLGRLRSSQGDAAAQVQCELRFASSLTVL